jgi:cytochrome c553
MIFRFLIAVIAAGVMLTVPAQGSAAGDAASGRQKARKCQTCHGIDGIATLPTAPHIAGENAVYLSSQLEAFRSGTRVHEIMSLIAKDLSDEDIADLSAWYASIKITVEMPE